MSNLEGHAAPAIGGVLHGIEDMARLRRRAHHGQHQAFRAHVHRPSDMVVLLRGRADDDRQIGRFEVTDGALHCFEMKAGMLQIEEDKVAAGGLQDMADARRGELDNEMPQLQAFVAGEVL